MNDSDEITGSYTTSGEFNNIHGFVRAANGNLVTFDIAQGQVFSETLPAAIDASGNIAGTINLDGNDNGFLRAPNGISTIFQVPIGGNATAVGLNASGVITGSCFDPSKNTTAGFVRAADVTFETFGIRGPYANNPVGVSDSGDVPTNVTVDFCSSRVPLCIPGKERAYLRTSSGLILPISEPSDTATIVTAISPAGQVIGVFYGGASGGKGYIRGVDGGFDTFSVSGDLTVPASINNAGAVTGTYVTDGVQHGFIRTP